MKTEEEEAFEIYTNLQVYNWDEYKGYVPDDVETEKKCYYMIDTIIRCVDSNEGDQYWRKVKEAIKFI